MRVTITCAHMEPIRLDIRIRDIVYGVFVLLEFRSPVLDFIAFLYW